MESVTGWLGNESLLDDPVTNGDIAPLNPPTKQAKDVSKLDGEKIGAQPRKLRLGVSYNTGEILPTIGSNSGG